MIQFQQAPPVQPKNDLNEALALRKELQGDLASEKASASSALAGGVFLTILASVSVYTVVGALYAIQGPGTGDTEALREFSIAANRLALFFGAGFTILTGLGSAGCWFGLASHKKRAKELENELGGGVE